MEVNWRELLTSKLIPGKLSVSKSFEIHQKHVTISPSVNKDGTVAVSVRVSDPSRPLSFSQLTARSADTIECAVFGTQVVKCNSPKLPPCSHCPLA